MMDTTEQTKACSKCGIVKPLSEFSKQASLPGGRKHQCKACDAKYHKQYYTENREQLLIDQAEYAKTHPEVCQKAKKKYADANIDKIRESRKVANLTPKRKENKAKTARKFKESNSAHTLFIQTRSRARKSGIPFTIEETDLLIPEICPVLGIPLFWTQRTRSGNTPSIDRIIPNLGYTPDNIAVISWRANRLKNDGTAEELHRIADWMDTQPLTRPVNGQQLPSPWITAEDLE